MTDAVTPLAPAFRTPRQAAAFCALLVVLLTLPLVLRSTELPGHAQRMETAPDRAGAPSFVHEQVYRETSDIDLVFVGDSVLWVAIDTPAVQRAASQALGRPARVLTLGWNWQGVDQTYYVLRDLLARRRVGAVVLRLPVETQGGPHPQSHRWLTACAHDEVQPVLPIRDRAMTYGIEAAGALRNLLSLLRPNLLAPSVYAPTLGAYLVELGYVGQPFVVHPAPQVETPVTRLRTPLGIFPRATAATPGDRTYAHGYAEGIRNLLDRHHVRLAFIRIPALEEAEAEVLSGDPIWSEHFSDDTSVLSVSPRVLFDGVPRAALQDYYYGDGHFNRNGAQLFTSTMMPALMELVRND